METNNIAHSQSEKHCHSCGKAVPVQSAFCDSCGTSLKAMTKQSAAPWIIVAYICAALSLLFFPPLFGILGIVFGSIAANKGDSNGKIAAIVSGVCMVVGIFFGMIIGITIASR